MSFWKKLVAGVGIALLSTALILPVLPLPVLTPHDNVRETIKISAGFGMPTACPFCWANDEITIDYPRTMRVNDSAIVEVRLASSGPFHHKLQPHKDAMDRWTMATRRRLKEPLALTLSTSSFTVAPSAIIEKPAGAPMPLTWLWTLSPTKEGNQQAVLDLEALSLAAYGLRDDGLSVPHLSVRINGVEKKGATFEGLRSEILKIEVLTKEGIRLQTFSMIQYSLALIGSILLYPAVGALLIKYFQKRKALKPSPILLP